LTDLNNTLTELKRVQKLLADDGAEFKVTVGGVEIGGALIRSTVRPMLRERVEERLAEVKAEIKGQR
jgi:hypothetical protein